MGEKYFASFQFTADSIYDIVVWECELKKAKEQVLSELANKIRSNRVD